MMQMMSVTVMLTSAISIIVMIFLRRYYVQAGRMDNRTLFNAQGGNFTFNFLPLGAIDGMRIGSTLSYLNQGAKPARNPSNCSAFAQFSC